ncbi:hypothetical protein [uncultured Sphingomonas sp.]|uniref:energy transducer TonB n=1 Tax=uncultured Sphingomonas sp. TaxID=158754 RepID=UPI0035C9A1AA
MVTGRRLSDTGAALKACIARHCPPDEDIRTTLAHAENQFVAGDYKQARVTLQDSAGRNRKFAKHYPVPVSDLLRASSRVDVHLGEVEDYRRTTLGSLDALKAGLPATDPRVLAERLEVADMFAQVGDFDQALDIYRKVAREAKALNLPVLEGTARLRTVSADLRVAADALGTGAEHEAVAEVDALAHDPDPQLASYAFVARVIRAQYDAKHGRPQPLEVVMAEMRTRLSGTRPVLIQADPIRMPGRPEAVTIDDSAPTRDSLTRLPVGSFEGQWVDVSFWIKPDGSVDDVGVLRESKPTVSYWDKPVLTSVRSRRYAPLKLRAGDPGLLRVERYTYTSFFDRTASESRIPTRDGQPRVEMLDLSDEPAGAAPGTSPAAAPPASASGTPTTG